MGKLLGLKHFLAGAVIAPALLWPSVPCATAGSGPVQEQLRERIEELSATGQLTIGDTSVAAVRLIPEIYRQRDFEPAWSDPADVNALLRMIGGADTQGLDPEDYCRGEIERLRDARSASPGDLALAADLDILLTESLIRFGYHMRFGKVNPENLDPDWNFGRSLGGRDPVAVILAALDSGDLEEFLGGQFPTHVFYSRLEEALARYRGIRDAGGWPTVPEGPVLKLGMSDPRMPSLRQRLLACGDLAPGPVADPLLYDAALVDGVIRFQGRHGLDADGAVGQRTLQALNVSVEERIDQIRVNLERARWILRNLSDEFIIVNIAGFAVTLVRHGAPAWSARAQVGKPFRKTPVFKGRLSYLEFNPTWTVPPTILSKDVLPAIRRDPGYLSKKNMSVIARNGKAVDPASIDWEATRSGGFPYSIRQEPGPNNALGRVKFIFPNKHFVFLHDTPSKSLFERSERAFSSGCIRVENPFQLAELILERDEGWDMAKIQQVLDSKRTQRVTPSDPLEVLLLYWTIDVSQAGVIRFFHDVYDRDRAVLEGLDADFTISLPHDVPDYLKEN